MKHQKAIAYLKAEVGDTDEVISMSEDDSPVLFNLGNGLLVAYLVDEDDSFTYIQKRDLNDENATESDLH